MAAVILTDIFCDQCDDRIQGTHGDKPNALLARSRAKDNGWIRVKHEGKLQDLCPACALNLGYAKDGDFTFRMTFPVG